VHFHQKNVSGEYRGYLGTWRFGNEVKQTGEINLGIRWEEKRGGIYVG